MKKSELYNEVKNYLLEHGWTQKTFANLHGRVCLVGAINRVYCNRALLFSTDPIYDLCNDLENTLGTTPVSWNDQAGRTFSEVMDLLDTMIIKAKEEEENYGR